VFPIYREAFKTERQQLNEKVEHLENELVLIRVTMTKELEYKENMEKSHHNLLMEQRDLLSRCGSYLQAVLIPCNVTLICFTFIGLFVSWTWYSAVDGVICVGESFISFALLAFFNTDQETCKTAEGTSRGPRGATTFEKGVPSRGVQYVLRHDGKCTIVKVGGAKNENRGEIYMQYASLV